MEALAIYHEKQVSQMCGVHCLNTLLQANAFNEVDLAQIAQELDRRERALMAEAGLDNEDYLKFVAADSQNVSDEGNFSIQVLSEALKVYNIRCVPIDSTEASNVKPESYHFQEAFILNLRDHWFTVRKLDGQWWNLNSMQPLPEKISDFYLSAFLAQLQAEHYTIFVIMGTLPLGDQSSGTGESGKWWSLDAIEKEKKVISRDSNFSDALKNTLQSMQGYLSSAGNQVQQALGSIGGAGAAAAAAGAPVGVEANEDADLRAAIAASLADQRGVESSEGDVQASNPAFQAQSPDSQRDLAAALAASLEEYNKNSEEDKN